MLHTSIPNVAYSVYDPSGHPVTDVPAMGADKIPLPEPVLPDPATIPRLEGGDATGPDQPVVTVPASDGSFDYFVTSVVAQDGSLVIVGWPMQDVAATLGQLATIEILVTVIVLVAAACVVTWLVAVALRPLTGIERTAARIAAGDIGQRIAPVDQRTEVGRLGHTLNTMLARIEIALAARAASEERLRRLVTDASHELRTPLTSIRGYAELFRRGADERPADLARAMRGIESESERMAELVDELLLLARLDEGPALPSTEVDLVPVVRSAVDAARAVEPDRPLAVHLPPRPSSGPTPSACARSWTTSSPMCASTRLAARRRPSPFGPTGRASSWKSPIPGWAWARRLAPASSSASSAPIRRGRATAADRGWGLRSCRRSPGAMAARSLSAPRSAAAPRSPSTGRRRRLPWTRPDSERPGSEPGRGSPQRSRLGSPLAPSTIEIAPPWCASCSMRCQSTQPRVVIRPAPR